MKSHSNPQVKNLLAQEMKLILLFLIVVSADLISFNRNFNNIHSYRLNRNNFQYLNALKIARIDYYRKIISHKMRSELNQKHLYPKLQKILKKNLPEKQPNLLLPLSLNRIIKKYI